jgi:hypothetical protein
MDRKRTGPELIFLDKQDGWIPRARLAILGWQERT